MIIPSDGYIVEFRGWIYHDRGPEYKNRRWIALGSGKFIERCSEPALIKAIRKCS